MNRRPLKYRPVKPLRLAQTRRRGVSGPLIVTGLAVGAVAIWAATRNGGGGGGTDAATPSGTISGVTVAQDGQISLGQVIKQPGDNVNVSYSVTFNTRDAAGNPISWPYVWEIALYDDATGQLVGSINTRQGNFSNTTINESTILVIPAFTDGLVLNVFLNLFAQTSDAQGQPTGTLAEIGFAAGNQQVQVGGVSGGGPAFQVGDTVSYVNSNLGIDDVTTAPVSSIITPSSTPGWSVYQIGSDQVQEWRIFQPQHLEWLTTHLFRVGDTISFVARASDQTPTLVTEQIVTLDSPTAGTFAGWARYITTNSTNWGGFANLAALQYTVLSSNTPSPS